jgi:hypothetical protein
MARSSETNNEGYVERLSRHVRNVSLLGSAALVGAGVLFPPAVAVAAPLVGYGVLTAGGSEVIHRAAKRQQAK